MEVAPDGSFLIEDRLEIEGSGAMTYVMCDHWLVEIVELEAGEYGFIRGDEQVRPRGKCFGIFHPPFAIVRTTFDDVRGRWSGMASTAPLPEEFMAGAMIFETALPDPPRTVEEVTEVLASSHDRQSIEFNPSPSLLSINAKRLIDVHYAIHPSIARIASRLGVSHEHLARQFKRDFGLSPSGYLAQVRIADAMFRLARGEEIIDVSHDVGYNDLSRFYKQFNKATARTPRDCQAPRKRSR